MIARLACLTVLSSLAAACQFEDRCGKDNLVYARGLCHAPPADAGAGGPASEGGAPSADAGAASSQCEGACELIGRCIAENPMAGGFLADQLTALGFKGTEREGCVTYCDDHSAGGSDKTVLACLAKAEASAMCDSTMLAGSLPAVEGVDKCCEGHADSEYCVAVCTALSTNQTAYDLVKSCAAIAP